MPSLYLKPNILSLGSMVATFSCPIYIDFYAYINIDDPERNIFTNNVPSFCNALLQENELSDYIIEKDSCKHYTFI